MAMFGWIKKKIKESIADKIRLLFKEHQGQRVRVASGHVTIGFALNPSISIRLTS